jgi:hypothetical protein
MKTKDRCGKIGHKAGMYLKKRQLAVKSRNVTENKGG